MRHHESSTAIYNKVIAKIERFSNLVHFVLLRFTLFATTMPMVISTYFNYYVVGLDDASFQELPFMYKIRRFFLTKFFLSFKMNKVFRSYTSRWPFNEKTPIGFLFQSIFQFAESFFWIIVTLTALSFLLGSCWLFMSFSEDIKNDLSVFNIKRSKQTSAQVKRKFRKIVKVFSSVHELSRVSK